MKTRSLPLFTAMLFLLGGTYFIDLRCLAEDKKSILSTTDEAFVKEAGASGMGEVKIATLGTQKAASADVKAFAQMMVDDHTKANAELQALAKGKGVELSQVIDSAHADKFQKLEKYSGAEFDKEFLSEMVSAHKKVVSNFESEQKKATDNEVKAFVDKTLPTLKAHLDKAKALHDNAK